MENSLEEEPTETAPVSLQRPELTSHPASSEQPQRAKEDLGLCSGHPEPTTTPSNYLAGLGKSTSTLSYNKKKTLILGKNKKRTPCP